MSSVKELVLLKAKFRDLVESNTLVPAVAEKIILDYDRLAEIIHALKVMKRKIVMTIGSYDMLHVGHTRYLAKAKQNGEILIVGIDSDSAIKRYKEPGRPIITAIERLEMLATQAFVDYVTVIDDVDEHGHWYYGLLRMVRPDVFVAVEDSYPVEQQEEIKQLCCKLQVLPRQAKDTSSTLIIQKLLKGNPKLLEDLQKEGEKDGR
mgnify:CR=1 FL=1